MRVGNKFVPFLSLIIFFVLGIVFCEFVPNLLSVNLIIAGAALGLSFSAIFFYKLYYKYKIISKVLISLTLFFMGCLSYVFHNNESYGDFYKLDDSTKSVILQLKSEVGSSEKYKKYYSELKFVVDQDSIYSSRAGVLLYLPAELSDSYNDGDLLIVHSVLTDLPSKINPYEFDYKKYLNRKGINYQVIAKCDELLIWEKGSGFLASISVFRSKMVQKFGAYLPKREAALAKALVLGYKDDLDVLTTKVFQDTGSMHVLAVSGLHLGILFLLLNSFFKIPILVKIPKWISFLIVVGILWFYALLSGFSISVIRASIMFSIIQFSIVLGRKGNVYNSLLVSAWIVLAIYPRELFQVGFQMSYLAVLGIVVLHPYINSWVESKWIMVNKLWEVLAVAVSAQLAVGVLSMYYFHSFPLLFPISNVLVMLVTGTQLGIGFLFILFSWLEPMVSALGILLSWLFSIELYCLEALSSFPYSNISNIYIEWYEMLLFYVVLLGLILVLLKRQVGMYLSSVAGFILGVVLIWSEFEVRNQDEIILFGSNDVCLVHVFGREAFVYRGAHLNDKSFEFFALPYLNHKGVDRVYDIKKHVIDENLYWVNDKENLVGLNGKCFGVYNGGEWGDNIVIPILVSRHFWSKLENENIKIPSKYVSASSFQIMD